ncbi:HAMP domain-containing protein [Clostridium sp. YIM B02565]|uniref:histidine kinase n=2 Tax=Clostridium paridis TaxID=2803863 RepID=A0A937FJA7_9CLOT|nr:HAMP domain-containing protein [Clostridium paridis]
MINKINRRLNRILNMKIMKPIKIIYRLFNERMEKSIRFELVVVFGICFLLAFFSYGVFNKMFSRTITSEYIEYYFNYGEEYYQNFVYEINKSNVDIKNKQQMDTFFAKKDLHNSSLAIVNADGKIYYKVNYTASDQVDLQEIFKSTLNNGANESEKAYVYPAKVKGENVFLIFDVKAENRISYKHYTVNNSFFALLGSLVVFVFAFIRITNDKMKYIEEISRDLKIIAEGDLKHRINEKGNDELKILAENINYMANKINTNIEKERTIEKTKNDLVTNVSHDLRTPLTSVMGYLGLVKEGKYESEEQMHEYLNIAFSKAERLKILIEDLFEFTKLTNEGIKLNPIDVNIVEFLSQITDEMMPLFEENELNVIQSYPNEKIMVSLDPDKMVRVLENLLTNAIKYSFKNSDVKVSIWRIKDKVFISVKNKGDRIDREKLNQIFERFYRMDEARTSTTSGSGLGLAIAKNIVYMHEGEIWAESLGDNISFIIRLNCKN